MHQGALYNNGNLVELRDCALSGNIAPSGDVVQSDNAAMTRFIGYNSFDGDYENDQCIFNVDDDDTSSALFAPTTAAAIARACVRGGARRATARRAFASRVGGGLRARVAGALARRPARSREGRRARAKAGSAAPTRGFARPPRDFARPPRDFARPRKMCVAAKLFLPSCYRPQTVVTYRGRLDENVIRSATGRSAT